MTRDTAVMRVDENNSQETFQTKSPWLSVWILNEIAQRYPELIPKSLSAKLWEHMRKISKQPVAWAVAAWLLFVFSNTLLLQTTNVRIATYVIDPAVTSDVIASFIDVAAALVGIVIPLIILLIEFLGRDQNVMLDVYFEVTRIRPITISALIVLALHAIAKFVFRTSIVATVQYHHYVLVLLLLLIIAVIWSIGLALSRLRETLDRDYYVQALLKKIKTEIRHNQFTEAKNRYGRARHIAESELLGITRMWSAEAPASNPDAVPLLALKAGTITDVHLPYLRAFADELHLQEGNSEVRAFFARFMGDSVPKDTPIAYVDNFDGDMDLLQAKLNKALKIEERPKTTRQELRRFLRHLKASTKKAAEENDDAAFDQFLDVYFNIIRLNVTLPEPPSSSSLPISFLSGWSSVFNIRQDLVDIIEVSARSQNEQLIRSVAFEISSIARLVIANSDVHVTSSFSDLLGLFRSVYSYSAQHENQTGREVAYYYLTREVIDRSWLRKLEGHHTDAQTLTNLLRILGDMLNLFGHLIRTMIDTADVEGLRSLINWLQPDEFLAYHGRIQEAIWRERLEIESSLRRNEHSIEEREQLVGQLDTLQSALAIREYITTFFNQLVFVGTSYALERYQAGVEDLRTIRGIWTVLEGYHLDFRPFLHTFVNLANSNGWRWDAFDVYPETKRGFFIDSAGKYYLLYCLRGIQLVSSNDIPEELPVVDIEHSVERIEKICEEVGNQEEKWALLFPDVEAWTESASEFAALNREIAELWKQRKEHEIINSDLSQDKLIAFQRAFSQTYSTSPSLRKILEYYGCVSTASHIPRAQLLQTTPNWEHKTFFSSASSAEPNVAGAEALGEMQGRQLVDRENSYIVSHWLRAARFQATRKDWQTLDPYIERASDFLSEQGYHPQLILLPRELLYTALSRSHDFRAATEEERSVMPHIMGVLRDLPVLQWPDVLERQMLIIDVREAANLEVSLPIAEVEALSEEEIQQRAEENTNLDERQLKLGVRIQAYEDARIYINDRNAIVRLPIKLPEELWYSPRYQQH